MFFDQLRINAFNSLNVRKGDFVTVVGNSAWFEITNDPPAESSLLNVASNELVLKSNVSAVHFQNDHGIMPKSISPTLPKAISNEMYQIN